MCGISGVILKPGEEIDPSMLKTMSTVMARRGPDAEGTLIRKQIGLVHRRLKIIDLSDEANQPMFNEEYTVAVVFNGEIYNFMEIREELKRAGHTFRNRSDTEVIVHAYEEWGVDGFARFNGMFAFGIWDGRGESPSLTIVRDRYGIKPLFFSQASGRFAFASELKPLLTLPWISKEVSPQTLFYFLKFSHVPTPLSILKDVQQLEPSGWIRIQGGEVTRGKIPSTLSCVSSTAPRPSFIQNEQDYLRDFEETLQRVVQRQVVSDVPLGAFLSGGIDSTLLTLACGKLDIGKIKTFTIGYKEAEFDEAPFAREVARALGTEHHEWIASPSDFFDILPDVPTYFDQPFADPTLLPSLLLARFAKERVTVALSGDGGDELFFGYSYQNALNQLKPLIHAPGPLRKGIFGGLRKLSNLMPTPRMQQLGKLSEILQFGNEAELFQSFVGTIGPLPPDQLAALIQSPVQLSPPLYTPMLEELKDCSWMKKIEEVFIRTFLTDTVLTKTDRTGMAFGLEARVPFLDDEMKAFSERLPFEWKHRNGVSKYLLRKLVKQKLPESISARKKQGFSIPLRDWFRTDLKYLLDEYLHSERLRRQGIFNPKAVAELVRSHRDQRANHSHLLFSLVMYQMWHERYIA